MEPTSNIKDDLLRAADQIEADGWYGGIGSNDDGRATGETHKNTCVGLALRRNESVKYLAQYVKAVPEAATDTATAFDAVYKWNDSQPDAQTVIDTLRAAATATPTK